MLANDVDVDGDALSSVLVDQPTGGALTLNTDGSFVYLPNAGLGGVDTFSHRASDGVVYPLCGTVDAVGESQCR